MVVNLFIINSENQQHIPERYGGGAQQGSKIYKEALNNIHLSYYASLLRVYREAHLLSKALSGSNLNTLYLQERPTRVS